MTFNTFINSRNLFQTCIADKNGESIYVTEGFSSSVNSLDYAKGWLSWFENLRDNKTNSIYYILAVPDNWLGGIISDNPYNGLQVKIGLTKNLQKRVTNLQTGSEGQLIIHAIEPGSRQREREIHDKFESDRRQGEWFICSMMLYKHIIETWKRNLLLPPEYQNAVLKLWERIRIYRSLHNTGMTFDMVNPSINDAWNGSVFLDLVHSNIIRQK